jgi:hypothetical protein
LNPYVRKAWGLERPVPPNAFTPEQCVYLNYHRQQVFEEIGGGRRFRDRDPARAGSRGFAGRASRYVLLAIVAPIGAAIA